MIRFLYFQLTDFDGAALLDEWNLCNVFQGDPQGTIHYNPPEVRNNISSYYVFELDYLYDLK